jgi:hypothetical protein
MKTIELLVRGLIVLAAGFALAQASDRVAVYARVDKAALEPNTESPETIQVWGVFSMAKPNDRNDYLPAARGYLYFKLSGDKEAARREWADLKQVAGSGQIVAFGNRYELKGQLRKPNERPENPDPYQVSIGLTRVRGNTEYPPVRALLDYKD